MKRRQFIKGVWSINDGDEQHFGIYFTGIELDNAQENQNNIDGIPIEVKPEKD